jgi:integrase
MSALKFTDTDLKSTVTKRVKVWDKTSGGVSGLYASKTPNICTFMYRYWDRTAKVSRTVEIGRFHPTEFNCAAARAKARTLDTDVKVHGKDVAKTIKIAAVTAHQGTKLFGVAVALYIDYQKEVIVKKGVERPRKEKWIYDQYALARPVEVWAKKQITDVTDEDIHNLVKSILSERKPEMARNTYQTLKRFFVWAGGIGQRFVTVNPMAFITPKSLDLPPPNANDRYLTEEEVSVLWHGLDRHDVPCDRRTALALKLILATALRPSEAGLQQREWIGNITKHQGGDGKIATRIPPEFVKLRRWIVQPLSPLACELVNEQLADGIKTGSLFPHGAGIGPKLTAHQLARELRGFKLKKTWRLGICEFLGFTAKKGQPFAPFTPHTLRRTATTLLGLQVNDKGQPLYTGLELSRILDHATPDEGKDAGSKTLKVYNVAEHVQQTMRRRPTLEALDQLLRGIIGNPPASNVVKLKAA